MKPNTLKNIDYTLGRILLVLLRPLVLLIDLLDRRAPSCAAPKKITFLKILGGGSLLIAYPALLGIRRRFPDARIILVCAREVRAYAELTDVFDEFVEIRTGSIITVIGTAVRALTRSAGSDVFVNYELHSKLSTIFSFFSLSRERYGLYQEWNRWQERYINHPIFYNSATPIYVGYEQIAQKIGAGPVSWADACARFQHDLAYQPAAAAPGAMKIGIAAYCSDLYKERQFSNAEFSRIVARHLPPASCELILFGGKSDQAPAAELATLLAPLHAQARVSNLAGQTSLRDVVTLFQSVSFLLSIDSGLNHLARLLGLKTVTYWGPSDPALRLRDITPGNDIIMYNKIPCSPCVHLIDVPPCHGRNLCMQQFLDPALLAQSNEGWEIR